MVKSLAFSDRELLWKGNLHFHNSNLVKHNCKFVHIICDSFGKIDFEMKIFLGMLALWQHSVEVHMGTAISEGAGWVLC